MIIVIFVCVLFHNYLASSHSSPMSILSLTEASMTQGVSDTRATSSLTLTRPDVTRSWSERERERDAVRERQKQMETYRKRKNRKRKREAETVKNIERYR